MHKIKMEFKKMFEEMESVKKRRAELLGLLQETSIEQVELWRRVPYLALEAARKGSFNPKFEMAYENGLWNISKSMCLSAHIDCDTGRIVEAYAGSKIFRLAKLERLEFVLDDLHRINAEKVIQELKSFEPPYGASKRNIESSIQEIYVRGQHGKWGKIEG